MSDDERDANVAIFRQLVMKDPEVWFRHFAVIKDKEGNLCGPGYDHPVIPNTLQLRCLEWYRYCQMMAMPCLILELKPRQKGASTIAEAIAYHHQRRNKGLNGALMGDIQATSDKVFEIYKRFAAADTFAWPDGLRLNADDDRTDDITLPNGSEYHKETAGSKNAGRGGTVQVARMTEPAFFQGIGEHDPVLAFLNSFNDQSPISLGIADTTPNGPKGWFYDTARSKTTSWKLIFAAWWEFEDSKRKFRTADEREEFMADLTMDEKEELRRFGRDAAGVQTITPEHLHWRRFTIIDKCGGDVDKFRQEYPSDPVECFLKSARPRFNSDVLQKWEDRAAGVHPIKRGSFTLIDDGGVSFSVDEMGGTVVFEEPKIGLSYILGGDYMTGEDQAVTGETADPDWHDMQVWRAEYVDEHGLTHRRKLVCRHKSQMDTDIVALETVGMSRYYGNCLIVPEVNGPGLHIVKMIASMDGNMYQRRVAIPTQNTVDRKDGWKTDPVTRKTIIDALAADVREDLLDIPDKEVVQQFKDFVTKKSGRPEAMSGSKDDAVLAAAIAQANMGAATRYEPRKRKVYSDRYLRRNPGALFRDGTRVVAR